MDKTVGEVQHIYEEAMALMAEREKDYEGSWKREGFKVMVGSLYRKASGTKTRLDNGRWLEGIPKTKEDLLDEINYCVLAYRCLEILTKEEK